MGDRVQNPGRCPPLSLGWAHTPGAPTRTSAAQSAATRSRSLILGDRNRQAGTPPLFLLLSLWWVEAQCPPPQVLILPARQPAPAAAAASPSPAGTEEKSRRSQEAEQQAGTRRPALTPLPRGLFPHPTSPGFK